MFQDPDFQQSFAATLSINNKPVVLAQKLLQKKLDDPEATEEQRRIYREELEYTHNLLTFGDGVTPVLFFFGYHDGVYIIEINDNDRYDNTASMEGSLRNLTLFDGTDPTYFRIKNAEGDTLKMTDLSDQHDILLYSGPQERPVCTYGELPYVQVITDLPNRGGQLAAFRVNITKRYS